MNETTSTREDGDVDQTMRREPFVFTGTAREYFGIWLVNVLLTILTLGIYSAWAKVRRMRFFHGSTWLGGASFEYHARPGQILLGRIIALALIAAYNLALYFAPGFSIVLVIGFFLALPYLVMRGLRFRARVTSYRNVRFDFEGGYWGALLAYVAGGVLTWGTLGVLAPVASRWIWSYTLGNLTYGGRPIDCDPRLEKLFGQWWLPAILFGGGILLFLIGSVALGYLYGSELADIVGGGGGVGTLTAGVLALIYVGFLPLIVLYVIVGLLYHAGSRNAAVSETVIDGRHALASSLGRWRYVWISITNLIATVFTLGLLRPWAAVRMARYLAVCTAVDTVGALDSYIDTITDEGAAVGAEYMDVEGLDFGF